MECFKAFSFLLLLGVNVYIAEAETFKVCADEGKRVQCQALERGSSPMQCVFVSDSVDCLLKMDRDEADFVILTAEEIMLAASIQTNKYTVLAKVVNEDTMHQRFAFQSVAVVRSDHKGGLQGLKGGGLCHPGYEKGKEQLWSDRVLKYFEKKVVTSVHECVKDSKSSAEDEAHNINSFFNGACRPGPWVMDAKEDANIKQKFPALCTLCTLENASGDCQGYRYVEPRGSSDTGFNSHMAALECLRSKRGSVAYVAYNHLADFLRVNGPTMNEYSLLCENGTTVNFNTSFVKPNPECAWVKQPWSAVISRSSVADQLMNSLKGAMPSGRANGTISWVSSLDDIMLQDSSVILQYLPNTDVKPSAYIVEGRPLPIPETAPCHKAVRWCTVSDQEYNKCTWVQKASLTVGLRPDISCVRGVSHMDCIKQVQDNRADFLSIDSNLGYMARKYYNLTSVMYGETVRDNASRVLAIVKEKTDQPIKRFENLKGKNACFPEYGGIAWTAFVRAAREQKVIKGENCDYAYEVANFFGLSCAPGARDPAHFLSKAADPVKLCAGCKGFSPSGTNEQGIVTLPGSVSNDQECPADSSNRFYGTTGALLCLSELGSDVAFIEGQFLTEKAELLSLNVHDYRVLCRNGSLASKTGFNVDNDCALSSTIDNEVIARRGFEDSLSLKLLLQELDTWFGYNSRTVSLISMKILSPFNKTKNLLFKDSTIGFATNDSQNEYVRNYIDLFKHVDTCSSAPALYTLMPILLSLVSVLFVKIFSY